MIRNILNDEENKNKLVLAAGLLVLAAAIGIFNMVFSKGNEKPVDANFKIYARTYYEKGFYDLFLQEELKGNVEEFRNYESGIKFNAGKIFNDINIDSNEEFKKKGDLCDLNNSYAVFYPYAPYGKNDYTLEIELVC